MLRAEQGEKQTWVGLFDIFSPVHSVMGTASEILCTVLKVDLSRFYCNENITLFFSLLLVSIRVHFFEAEIWLYKASFRWVIWSYDKPSSTLSLFCLWCQHTALDSGLFVLKKQEGENLGVREKPWLFLLQESALSLSGYQSRTSDRETTETEKKKSWLKHTLKNHLIPVTSRSPTSILTWF